MTQADTALAPLRVADAEALAWDESADVVIVGFGGAGAVAAIQARDCGASVIALDRFAGGGATAFSGGVIYAGGTRHQQQGGYEDSAAEMFKYLDAEGSAVSHATLRRYCENSRADLEWLEGFGIPYGGRVFEEKTAFPPNAYWLYYSGNEKMPAYASRARPAPRGHRVAINGFGGRFYYQKLREAALGRGVRLIQHAPVTRLVVDADERIIGVQINALPEALWSEHLALYRIVHPWRPFNGERIERAIAAAWKLEQSQPQPRLIRARHGVLLSTGGFNHNAGMTARYRPVLARVYKKLLRLGSMGDDGSGVRLAESVGAATALMDHICVARTLVPPNVFVHGIVVNEQGQRFVNEAAYAFVVGAAIIEQSGGGKAWLLLQARDFWTGVWKSFFPGGNFLLWGAPALLNIFFGGTRRATSLARLATKIGVDAGGLAQTVLQFNALAEAGHEDPFGKLPELLRPLAAGPFYAVNLSLDNRFAPAQTITMGGLDVDEESGAVKRVDGSLIKGLYAAGRVAVGICSNGYMSGLSIADTVFSGRRAGRAMSAEGQANSSRMPTAATSFIQS